MEITVWSCNFPWVYLVKHALSALKKKSAIQILKKDLYYKCDFLVLNETPPLRNYKNHMAVKNLVL